MQTNNDLIINGLPYLIMAIDELTYPEKTTYWIGKRNDKWTITIKNNYKGYSRGYFELNSKLEVYDAFICPSILTLVFRWTQTLVYDKERIIGRVKIIKKELVQTANKYIDKVR